MTTSISSPQASARFLSVAELAATLRVSEVTIYREINRGGLPAVRIRGRYVIPAKVLDRLEADALDAADPDRDIHAALRDL